MLLPALGLPMIVSVTSRSVRSFAIASSRYDSPFRATSAEAVVISRPGTRATSGPRAEQVGVDTDRDQPHALQGDTHVGVDVADRVLAHDDDARHPRRHPALHLDERVPPPDRPALAPIGSVLHLQLAVLGDRMVEGDDGWDLALEGEDPVAEALVVVHEVELADARLERPQGAVAEGERLGERSQRELRQLEQVLAGLDLPVGGEAAGVVVVEHVEAGQLGEGDPLVEHRVGLPPEDLDVVPEVDERLGQVAGVDALPTDVRLAPVGEIGDRQRPFRPGRDPAGYLAITRAGSC